MNILIDPLVEELEVGKRWIPINADFRAWIALEILLEGGKDAAEIMEEVLGLIFPYIQPEAEELPQAMSAVAGFYCGVTPDLTKDADETSNPRTERLYSFEHDADYIFAAFYQQYDIDLTIAKLHWWKFKALFAGLSDACPFVKIMGYRGAEITPDMPKSEAERLEQMKKLYALPRPARELSQEEELSAVLMGNGDYAAFVARKEAGE